MNLMDISMNVLMNSLTNHWVCNENLSHITDISINYSSFTNTMLMQINNNYIVLQLNNLDINSIRLSNIFIETNDYNLKLGNIEILIGNQKTIYPVMMFNIIKTNNGYQIDLGKLIDYGFGNILTKFLIYNQVKLFVNYSGNIDNASLEYFKAIKDNYLNNFKNFNINITNINLSNIISESNIINTNLNFFRISNKIEINCTDVKEDYESLKLMINNNIYDNYILDINKDKLIIKFNTFINFSKIDNCNLIIKFKNSKNRNIIIFNDSNNTLQIYNGVGGYCYELPKYKEIMFDIKTLCDFNCFQRKDINNLSLNSLDLHYM